jgi:alpha-glucosidase
MVHADTPNLMERIRGFTDAYPGIATLGEVSSQEGALARIGRYTGGEGRRLHMAYTLETMKRSFSRAGFLSAIAEAERSLTGGWLCWAFSNHDVDRAVSRWMNGAAGDPVAEDRFARLLMALMLTLKGSVCIYQGEELGLTHVEVPHERMRDPYGIAFYPAFRGRDAARTPVPWSKDGPAAGFTTSHDPWLPVPEVHRRLAVAEQEADPGSVLSAWQDFLRLRRRHPALRHGVIDVVGTPDPVLAFRRQVDGESLLVILNLAGEPVALDRRRFGAISPLPDIDFPAALDRDTLQLDPYGYLVAQ